MKLIWLFLLVCPSSAGMCLFSTLPWSWPDHKLLHLQLVCACSWPFHEIDLTISPSSAGMCLFLILPWSWSDYFSLSAYLQLVYAYSWLFHEVDLTISSCLPILRGYVLVFDSSIKLTWPFLLVCPSSAGMCLFLIFPWSQPDHFFLSAHFQQVCACSWPFHNIDVIISPFSGGMCLFLTLPWSQPDHFSLSAFLQQVCACSGPFHEVDMTISSSSAGMCPFLILSWSWADHFFLSASGGVCLFLTLPWCWPDRFSIFSRYVLVLDSSMKLTWLFLHLQKVCACSWSFHKVNLTISPCLPFFRGYVFVLVPFRKKLIWQFILVCPSSGSMCLFLTLPWCWSDHFSIFSRCVLVLDPFMKLT